MAAESAASRAGAAGSGQPEGESAGRPSARSATATSAGCNCSGGRSARLVHTAAVPTSQVVGLGAAGGEHDLGWVGADQRGDLGAGRGPAWRVVAGGAANSCQSCAL